MLRNKVIFSAALAICIVGLIIFAEAQEKPSPTLEKAIGQYKHENYEEALVLLKKAREENPESSLTAYYLGLTYKQIQDYKAAIPYLKDAITFEPKIAGALIELIDCDYQLGRVDEAKLWVAEAEKEGIRPAQVAFLKGLVLVKADEADSAIEAFKNAKELDKSMAASCNYQIGIANLKTKKFAEARNAFEQVVIVDPVSNIANYANEYKNSIDKRLEAERPFRFEAGAAWQYDDNVVLKPSDTSIATDIADKADSREVYTAQAELYHRFSDFFSLKGQYNFYYAKQNNLGFYDTVSNTFVIQPNIYLKDSLLTFPSGYSHFVVNDKNYLSAPFAAGIYNFMVNTTNMIQLYTQYQYNDYLWTPSIDDEGRKGNDLGGGLGWYYFFAKNKGFINLRYGILQQWTTGNNWQNFGNRVSAVVLMPIIDKLNVTVSGDIYFQNFENSHSIFHVYRRDQTYSVSALGAYKFYKDCEIQLQYTHVKDDSNISIYGYDRNIYSAGVNLKF